MVNQATALIVEDAETCASTLEILLGSIAGLNILTASTAERAWELLDESSNEIHALVTDLHMPGMDGLELIRRVRADPRHRRLRIVVITGSTDPNVPELVLKTGADAVFSKPYSPARVREKLEQLLKNEMRSA